MSKEEINSKNSKKEQKESTESKEVKKHSQAKANEKRSPNLWKANCNTI